MNTGQNLTQSVQVSNIGCKTDQKPKEKQRRVELLSQSKTTLIGYFKVN